MSETLTFVDSIETEKIRTHHAKIVVECTTGKPYYSIKWFDAAKQEYYVGYSSYVIDNVLGWLKEYFEIVEAPKTNAERIRAMSDEELAEFLTHINPTNCQDCAFSHGWRCKPDRDDYSDFKKCEEGRKRWLQQPAGEADNETAGKRKDGDD